MDKKNIEDIYPLTPLQEAMLVASLKSPESSVYVEQACYNLPYLPAEIFDAAWREVMARHPVLRTGFIYESVDKPAQVVLREVECKTREVDLRSLPEEQRQKRIAEIRTKEANIGFQLSRPPLMRTTLVHTAPDKSLLIWTFHHIVLDAWSAVQVFNEALQIGEAQEQGSTCQLPPAPPFRNYIRWLQQRDLSAAEAYWRSALAGFGGATPLDLPESGVTGLEVNDYALVSHTLPDQLSRALAEYCRSMRLTQGSLHMGTWACLLSLYSGEDDVLFGFTTSGRPTNLPDAESMVGLLVNTLPLRVRLNGAQGSADWLHRLQQQQIEVREYEYCPLVDIQRWSGLPAEQPLFHSILTVESALNLSATNMAEAQMDEHLDLPLSVVVVPGTQTRIRVQFHPSQYSTQSMERLLRHYEIVLQQLIAKPQRPLASITLLPPREQALPQEAESRDFNLPDRAIQDSEPVAREPATLEQAIQARVAEQPEATALVCGEQRLSYAQLDLRARRLASGLERANCRPGDLIPILFEPGVDVIITMLALLYLGCAYAPLGLDTPKQRLLSQLRALGCRRLLSHRGLSKELEQEFEVLDVPALETDPMTVLPPADPQRLLYVIHTSGSTGIPKAAGVYQNSYYNLIQACLDEYNFNTGDRGLLTNRLAHDLSQKSVWIPLVSGGELHILEGMFDPQCILELLPVHNISWLNITPSMAYALVENAGDFSALAGIRHVFLGGEPIITKRLRPWAASPSCQAVFVNAYGPTEASDITHWQRIDRNELLTPGAQVSTGRALPNVLTYVLDLYGNRLPQGLKGEIAIGGLPVGCGYLNSPTSSAERFLPDPYCGRPGARMYLTGDVGWLAPDGSLQISGRIDFQTKIRGFRVEPSEIDAVLRNHPDVTDAITLVRGSENPELISYVVVPDTPAADLREQLLWACRDALPPYMLPTAIVPVDNLPINANGKLDRGALPAPRREDRPSAKEPVAPRNQAEEAMLKLWQQLLPDAGAFGVEDSFFDLGGHSLLLTRLYARIPKAFGAKLPLSTLFTQPTIAAQARALQDMQSTAMTTDDVPTPQQRPQHPPLSHSQEQLWFLHRYAPESPAYNVPLLISLPPVVDPSAARLALEQICQRHEILRTRFPAPDGQPYQEVLEHPVIDWQELNLGHTPEAKVQQELSWATIKHQAKPFDLADRPPLRALLVLLPNGTGLFTLVMHHTLTDGWSTALLRREWQACYQAAREGRSAALPEPELQYIDYTLWQRHRLTGENLEKLVDYWRNQLEGHQASLSLPLDYRRPNRMDYNGSLITQELDGSLREAVDNLTARLGVSRYTLLCALFATLMYRLSGQRDFNIGTPIANRHHPGTENLAGCLVNTLVLRFRLKPQQSFIELVNQTRDLMLGAQDHQDLPLELMVDKLAPTRRADAQPLFQVLFTLESQETETLPIDSGQWVARFDLQLTISPFRDGFKAQWEYRNSLFQATTVNGFAQLYKHLLQQVLTAPEQNLECLPTLNSSQVPVADMTSRLPYEPSIESLFAEQARARPKATALICGGKRMTYGEQEQRANRLAHWLRNQGIKANQRIGISLPRGFQLCTTLLGLLKAGAAYVPLDPTYPDDRLDFMADDADLSLLLTDSQGMPRWARSRLRVINLEESDLIAKLEQQPDTPPPAVDLNNAERVAYLTYTSGTTGRPKGVVTMHRGVIRLVRGRTPYPLNQDTVILQAAPIAFDASTWEIWGPLLNGGSVAIYDAPYMDPDQLDQLLASAAVNTAFLTAALFRHWVARLQGPTPLRWLLAGGEVVSPNAVAQLYALDPDIQIFNGYGPTENTTFSTYSRFPRNIDTALPLPIGKAVDHSSAWVLDEAMQPVATGVVGQLYVGGEGLALGYHKRPALTAERFLPNPFGPPGSRLYATGDLARMRPDGQIEFLGRTDYQLKIRGFRIEPAEVERVLQQHPKVSGCVVLPHDDPHQGTQLAAYLEVNTATPMDQAELERFARTTLPDYMIPRYWILLDKLPVNTNGKLDRQRLPPPETQREPRTQLPPEGELEEHLLGIWQQLLGRNDFGVTDDFFALGGHSLLTAQLAAAIRSELSLDIPLETLFSHPTVREQANWCDLARWHTEVSTNIPLDSEQEETGTL